MKDIAEGKRLLILQLLIQHGPMTGGELADLDASLSRDTIYVTLLRMEKEKAWLKSRKEEVSRLPGPPARYYRVTALGKEAARLGEIMELVRSGAAVLAPAGGRS